MLSSSPEAPLPLMRLFAVLVAGGRSSRLHASAPGTVPDKPLLADAKGTLLDHGLTAVAEAGVPAEHTVVVGPEDLQLSPDLLRTREEPAFSGPAQAVRAGLAALPGEPGPDEWVLVLAADMPRPESGIDALMTARQQAQDGAPSPAPEEQTRPGAFVAEDEGIWQPLFCLLNRSLAVRAFAEDAAGSSMRSRLRRLNPVTVPVPAGASADVDTWADAQALGFAPVGSTFDSADAPAPPLKDSPSSANSHAKNLPELSWSQARDVLYQRAESLPPLPVQTVPLAEALGRTLAEPVHSPVPAPHFSSSAMDGWAVAGQPPWQVLTCTPQDAQGRNLHRRTLDLSTDLSTPEAETAASGRAVEVLTGSLLPEGVEGILRAEHGQVSDGWLMPLPDHPYQPGRDLRWVGEEMSAGAVLLSAGEQVTARHLALFAACGVDELPVTSRPRVALAVTGNEVIATGVPGPGQVRDAFSASVPALVSSWGARVVSTRHLEDAPGAVESWWRSEEAEVLVLTGGSGHSGQDYVRRALEAGCTEILAASVRMRPGHPTVLGLLPPVTPGGRRRLVLGLPGNPMAAHAALFSFLPDALSGMLRAPRPPLTKGRLVGEVPPGRNPGIRVMPATVDDDGQVRILPKGQSHMLSGLAAADALAILPQGLETGARDHPEVLLLPL